VKKFSSTQVRLKKHDGWVSNKHKLEEEEIKEKMGDVTDFGNEMKLEK